METHEDRGSAISDDSSRSLGKSSGAALGP